MNTKVMVSGLFNENSQAVVRAISGEGDLDLAPFSLTGFDRVKTLSFEPRIKKSQPLFAVDVDCETKNDVLLRARFYVQTQTPFVMIAFTRGKAVKDIIEDIVRGSNICAAIVSGIDEQLLRVEGIINVLRFLQKRIEAGEKGRTYLVDVLKEE